MHFRVTDERDWQYGFDAETAALLADGIRRGCAAYAARGESGTLRLHVWGRTDNPNGIWLTPSGNPTAPAVTADKNLEWCERWIADAFQMVRHHERLWSLGDEVAEAVRVIQEPPGRGRGGN